MLLNQSNIFATISTSIAMFSNLTSNDVQEESPELLMMKRLCDTLRSPATDNAKVQYSKYTFKPNPAIPLKE